MRWTLRWLGVGSLLAGLCSPAAAQAQPMSSAAAPSADPPSSAASSAIVVAPAASSPPVLSATSPTESVDLPHGVVIIAADDTAANATWDLAARVYQDPLLRPARLNDAVASALVGERPRPGSATRALELFELRRSFTASSAAPSPLLAALAREFGASAVIVVSADAPDHPSAKLFLPSRASFVGPALRPVTGADLRISWAPLVAWLHTQAHRSHKPPTPAPAPAPPASGSFLSSSWFWGALVVATGVGIFAYAASSRDEASSTIHLQGRVVR